MASAHFGPFILGAQHALRPIGEKGADLPFAVSANSTTLGHLLSRCSCLEKQNNADSRRTAPIVRCGSLLWFNGDGQQGDHGTYTTQFVAPNDENTACLRADA